MASPLREKLSRSWPGAVRSSYLQGSFAAWGKRAATITANHDLEQQFGDKSPLGRIYDLDGYVFLLGVGHGNNTSLHLAEERMPHPKRGPQGSAVTVDGVRQWVTFETVDYDADDFVQLGAVYEVAYPDAVRIGTLGKTTVRLMRQRRWHRACDEASFGKVIKIKTQPVITGCA